MNNNSIIARLTLTHKDETQSIIEIHTDASHDDFFRWYKREKGRRIKQFIRTDCRSRNIHEDASLEALAERLTKHFQGLINNVPTYVRKVGWDGRLVTAYKIIVFKKKLYRRFLKCSNEQLPGYRPVKQVVLSAQWVPSGRRSQIGPRVGHRSPQQKMNRLMGKV